VYPPTYSVRTRVRNDLMLQCARWGGLRRGELLKLQCCDIGPAGDDYALSSGALATERQPYGEPGVDEIRILRRPDDPEDSRNPPPKVKSRERIIAFPTWLIVALHAYADGIPPIGRRARHVKTPYLFVDLQSGLPLSLAAADDAIKAIRIPAATRFAEIYPEATHTLKTLSWHRFRHTRAKELLLEFRDEGAIGIEKFCDYFGWKNLKSAEPYINDLLAEIANQEVRESLRGLKRSLSTVTGLREGRQASRADGDEA
jgi:integrase